MGSQAAVDSPSSLDYSLGMPNRSSIKDVNQSAKSIADRVAQNVEDPPGKNPAAVALGRIGGLKGGKARAQKLSSKRRKAIAQKAAKSRWAKRDGK